jgi:hypothetical protein
MLMNCDLAIELLPWLLNDTLEGAERQQVLEHLASCPGCRLALAETRTAAAIFDWHPPAAELIAHAGGEEAPAGLAEHLAACPPCAAEVELLRTGRLLMEGVERDGGAASRVALLRPPGERSDGGFAGGQSAKRREDRATSRVWRRAALAAGLGALLALAGWLESARTNHALEERLAAAPRSGADRGAGLRPATGSAAPIGGAEAAGSSGTGLPAPTAAPAPPDARAAALGHDAAETQAKLDTLSRENSALEQRVAELGRVAAETATRTERLAPPAIESGAWTDEVSPSEQTQRGGEAPAAETIPLSAGAATLLLKSRRGESFAAYEIEIHDAHDGRVGSAVPVARRRGGQDSFPEFDVVLRRGALAPGTYTLHLFGHSAKGREVLDTYSIRVS